MASSIRVGIGFVDAPLVKFERAEPPLILRDDALFARVPFETFAMLDVRGEVGFEQFTSDGRGETNHRFAITGIEIGDDQEFRLRQALRWRQLRAATAG